MMNWLNQHSFLVLVLTILALAIVTTSGIGRPWLRGIVIGFVAVIVVAGYMVLTTGTSTHATEASVVATFGGGTPTLLEFYSDY